MYVQFFRLSEAPFSITPDPAFLYLSPRHHEALAHLLYGTGEGGGFVALTGEVGTGKTTVLRTLLQQQLPQVDTALIYNPRQNEREFLQSICDELGVSYPDEAPSIKQLVDALNRHLLDAHAAGRRTVLIIDEAQNLPEDVLEQVRLLTNLETHKQKLLRIILVGQPELNDLLARPSMRQLAQRITARFHLTALDADETAEYIAHRLRVAGGDADIFERRAIDTVYRHSGGIPRLVNVICDRAMMAAYSLGTRHISAGMVRDAAREVMAQPPRTRRLPNVSGISLPRLSIPWVPGVAFAGMLLAAFLLSQWWRGDLNLPPSPPEQPVELASAPAEDATPAVPDHGAATALLPDSGLLPEMPDTNDAAPPQVELPLDRMMTRLPPLGDQVEILLGLWDEDIEVRSGERVCDAIAPLRLRCLNVSGDWDDLQQMGRPAILALVDADGDHHHALLTALGDDSATLLVNDRFVPLARRELDLFWTGDIFTVWQSPFDDPRVIRPGDQGDDVVWLREALKTVRGESLPDGIDATFDDSLRGEVEDFQRAHGLTVDGHVGERTKIVLMRELRNNGPTLGKAEP